MHYDFFIAHPGVHWEAAAALEKALHARGRTAFRDKSQRGAGGWPRRIRDAQVQSWITVVLLGKHEEGNHPWFDAECAAAIELAKDQHGLFVVRLPDFGKQAVPYGLPIADQMYWTGPGGAEEVAQSLDAILRQHVRLKRHPSVCLIGLIDILAGWLAADRNRARDINRALSRLELNISMLAPEGAPLIWRAAHALYRLADQAAYEQHSLSSHGLIRFLHELHIVEEPFAKAIHDWLDDLASHYGGHYEDTVSAGPSLEQFLLVDVYAGELPGLWRADLVHRAGTTAAGWDAGSGRKLDAWAGTDLERLADHVALRMVHLPDALAIEVILPIECLDQAPGLWCNKTPSRGHSPLDTALCNHGQVYLRVAERFGGAHLTMKRWQAAFQRALKARNPARCCEPGEVPSACVSHGAMTFEAHHAPQLIEALLNHGVPIASWADETGPLKEPPRDWRSAVRSQNLNGKKVRLLWDDPTRLREPDPYDDLDSGSDVQ